MKKRSGKILIHQSEALIVFPHETMIGALAEYISTPNEKFQPMNANFGIIKNQNELKIKDKKQKYRILADKSIEIIKKMKENEILQ